MDDYSQMAKAVCYLTENAADQPDLEVLARAAGLSPSHFQRKFVRWVGVSPKDFLQCLLLADARAALGNGVSVETAAWAAGMSGPGRLHDLCVSLTAATPGEIRRGGLGMDICYGYAPSPFGECLLGMTPRGICHLAFTGGDGRGASLERLRRAWPAAALHRDDGAALLQATGIFDPDVDSRGRPPLKLLVKGTPFQVRVWQALLQIPEGEVVSYGQLAAEIRRPGAARAVGSAVGANSIAYLIPCHRVIRGTGVTGTYRWGNARKKIMLALEAARRDRNGRPRTGPAV